MEPNTVYHASLYRFPPLQCIYVIDHLSILTYHEIMRKKIYPFRGKELN